MKKYRIELSEQQMRLIADCLEDVSRFASGQWEMRYTVEEMLRGLPFDEKMKGVVKLKNCLNKLKEYCYLVTQIMQVRAIMEVNLLETLLLTLQPSTKTFIGYRLC